jgi:hypothetical protein
MLLYVLAFKNHDASTPAPCGIALPPLSTPNASSLSLFLQYTELGPYFCLLLRPWRLFLRRLGRDDDDAVDEDGDWDVDGDVDEHLPVRLRMNENQSSQWRKR